MTIETVVVDEAGGATKQVQELRTCTSARTWTW